MKTETYTCEACGQQHPYEFSLLCSDCRFEAESGDGVRECPSCERYVRVDEDGSLDCQNCREESA